MRLFSSVQLGILRTNRSFQRFRLWSNDTTLDIPIIGVAKAGWTLDQLRVRARQSVAQHCGVDKGAFAKLSALLQYVDGDYREPGTYTQLRKRPGRALRPLHYLAIPPSMFATVADGLAQAECAAEARVVMQKPFGRDPKSARELKPRTNSRLSGDDP